MKHIVFSDLHNNYFALQEFYNYLTGIADPFNLYFLGDVIGYYKFDLRIINLLETMTEKWNLNIVIGNHDAAFFNYFGLTKIQVKDSISLKETVMLNAEYSEKIVQLFPGIHLKELNLKVGESTYIFSHGGISDIINDYYYPDMNFLRTCKYNFIPGAVYVCGHTHRPFIKKVDDNVFINAGSLGMPRDGDPRLCFLEIEDNSFRIIRKFYDMDSLYDYNDELRNDIKNRIYIGGNSKFISLELLNISEEMKDIENYFASCFAFKKAIYIIHNDTLFEILRLKQDKSKYLLRSSREEILFDDTKDIVRRIKNEKI